jgi:ABC-2 type transport system permease protein
LPHFSTWCSVALAHIDPLYYAVEAARDLSAGTIDSVAVGQGFIVLGLLTAITLWWTTRVFRRAFG